MATTISTSTSTSTYASGSRIVEALRWTLGDYVFATTNSFPLFFSRLALGLVMLPHGLQKTFGLFGGEGFFATMTGFTSQGIPGPLAFLAIAAEFAGSLGLISGFMARIAAFGILCNMLVAVLTVHIPNGFFMNWMGDKSGEGFEYHVLAIGIAIAVLIGGAGKLSVDRSIRHY